MQRKSIFGTLLVVAFVLAINTKAAFGQLGGCTDSPEDPTAVMALVGGAAAFIPMLSARLRSRKRRS
jgi:XrtJ-associated TM-motif-TM protein